MLYRIARECLEEEIAHSGAHPTGIAIMKDKGAILPLKLVAVRTPAVNIIKQEMLALGAECVTPAGAVTCARDRYDIILLGTKKHYRSLLLKLRAMNYFGMGKLAGELESFLAAETPQTVLANGKVIKYTKPMLMGILNINEDSFYAASRVALEPAVERAGAMLKDGAAILDIGGESTRPGAEAVPAEEEMKRVVPVIAAVRKAYPDAVISCDTYHAATAQEAAAAGADIINDISGGRRDAEMLSVVKKSGVPLVITHSPAASPAEGDVVERVIHELLEQVNAALEAGIPQNKIIIDPGIGFGKTYEENLRLIRSSASFASLGYPLLLGASRKSVIGGALHREAEERLNGTLAVTAYAAERGVNIIRVHDVRENAEVLKMLEAIAQCR